MQNMRESAGATRIERDTPGAVAVPAEHPWGAQTERAVGNFAIGRPRFGWGRPVILYNVLEAADLLTAARLSFDEPCARGVAPSETRNREHRENSLMLVTALTPRIGCETAAGIALKAHREGSRLKAAALAPGTVAAEQFALWVKPGEMTHPLPEDRRDG